jgi:hypothetical protein
MKSALEDVHNDVKFNLRSDIWADLDRGVPAAVLA